MSLFIDIHKNVEGITKQALEEAHQKDLEVQGKYGVHFINYWYSEEQGTIFCLCDAPDKESAQAVHREAHGQEADEIIEVHQGEA